MSFNAGHFIFAKQETNTTGHFVDDLILTRQHLLNVNLHGAHLNTMVSDVMTDLLKFLGRRQQSFGWDAAHVQTRAA